MNKNKIFFLFILIVLLGTFLRFYNIGAESFWLDEGATALTIKSHTVKEIFYNTATKGQILPEYYESSTDLPPYYVVLKIWSNIFGLSEASLRSLSAIFGSLSIIIVYLLSKELFNQKVSLIAALIMSLNTVMIEYSQEARLYSSLILIVLLSGYSLIKYSKTNRNTYLAAFTISNLIGIYLHYPFVFFIIFEGIYVFYPAFNEFIKKRKLNIKKIHYPFILFFIAYLTLLYRILNLKLVATHFAGSLSFSKLAKIFLQFNTWIYPSEGLRLKLNNSQFQLFGLYDWLLILSVVLIVIFLSVFFIKGILDIKSKKQKSLIFLISWLILPLLAALVVLYSSFATFGSIRPVIFIVPAYLIIASYGFSTLKNKNLAALLIVFSVLSIIPLVAYYSNVNNPQYRESALFLEDNIKKNDLVIANIQTVTVPFAYYSDNLVDADGISNVEDAKKVSDGKDSVWLALSATKYSDPKGLIRAYFDENFRLEETRRFYDVELLYYTR